MLEYDQIQRFIFENKPARGEIIRLKASYQTALSHHHYPQAVGQLLGKGLVASALLCATIKFEGTLILQAQGDGFVNPLVAQCDDKFHVRGIAKYPQDEVLQGPMLGNGHAAITLLQQNQKDPYQGIVKLQNDCLEASLEDYFKQSEQLATRIILFANDDVCAGLFLQEMPSSDDDDGNFFEHISILANTLKQDELLELPFETVLNRLYSEDPVRIFSADPVSFHCSCNINKMEKAVQTMGYEESHSLLADKQVIDVTCEFCNHTYSFDKVDVARIFEG